MTTVVREADARRDAAGLASQLASAGLDGARVGLVLGSGLGALAERVEGARAVGFDELELMPSSAVPGHAGRFVRGRLGGAEVIVKQGRVHLYEGWSPFEVTRSMRAFAQLGVEAVILTNAAGGLVPEWTPPTLMALTDHIALQGESALLRAEAGYGSPYDADVRALLLAAAESCDLDLKQGVYAALRGPSYETAAEIRHLAMAGAQAVGMSTVLEATVAHACGLRVGGVSCISNLAAGISPTRLDHAEVVAAGAEASGSFCDLLEETARLLAS